MHVKTNFSLGGPEQDADAWQSYLGGVGKRAEDWKSASPVDGKEQQSEYEDSNGGYGAGAAEDGADGGDADEDGEDGNNDANLLAVSQTNWGVISGTAGNGGERQKLKYYQT